MLSVAYRTLPDPDVQEGHIVNHLVYLPLGSPSKSMEAEAAVAAAAAAAAWASSDSGVAPVAVKSVSSISNMRFRSNTLSAAAVASSHLRPRTTRHSVMRDKGSLQYHVMQMAVSMTGMQLNLNHKNNFYCMQRCSCLLTMLTCMSKPRLCNSYGLLASRSLMNKSEGVRPCAGEGARCSVLPFSRLRQAVLMLGCQGLSNYCCAPLWPACSLRRRYQHPSC